MDIVADLLTIALDGAKKTRIMYDALVSFSQLKNYLELLTDIGLLEYSEQQREYRTTENGKHFLKIYSELRQMVNITAITSFTKTKTATPTPTPTPTPTSATSTADAKV
jgi:predicted transcriptional regulator